MAEHTKRETEILANIFAEEYNRQNTTKFEWDNLESYQPGEPYDFKLIDGEQELGVQIVRAVADPEREYVRANRAAAVIDPLRESLEKSKLPSLSIYLNFENPPKNQKETTEAIFWLEYFIQNKVRKSISHGYFQYDTDDDEFLEKITKYVSDIAIIPLPSAPEGTVLFGYGSSSSKPESWPDDETRIVAAAGKKEKLYSDIIVLVDSGTFPISDFYIPLIKQGVANMRLKQIWVVDNFSSQQRAIRIK